MDPDPSRQPVLTRPDQVPMSRVDVVRAEMGLSPLAPSDMARVMEAAVDDVTEAVRFVKEHHADYGIDPGRIVLGGFSQGCAMTLMTAMRHPETLAGMMARAGFSQIGYRNLSAGIAALHSGWRV